MTIPQTPQPAKATRALDPAQLEAIRARAAASLTCLWVLVCEGCGQEWHEPYLEDEARYPMKMRRGVTCPACGHRRYHGYGVDLYASERERWAEELAAQARQDVAALLDHLDHLDHLTPAAE